MLLQLTWEIDNPSGKGTESNRGKGYADAPSTRISDPGQNPKNSPPLEKKRKSGQGRPRAQAWTDSKEWSKPNGWLSAAALFSPSEATHNPRWLLRDPCQWPKKGKEGRGDGGYNWVCRISDEMFVPSSGNLRKLQT